VATNFKSVLRNMVVCCTDRVMILSQSLGQADRSKLFRCSVFGAFKQHRAWGYIVKAHRTAQMWAKGGRWPSRLHYQST